MSNSDCLPDYPLNSDLVRRLKSALAASDEERVSDLICTEVGQVDAVIELANDDWMKDPSAQLPPGVLLGVVHRTEACVDRARHQRNGRLQAKWAGKVSPGRLLGDWFMSSNAPNKQQNSSEIHSTAMERRPEPVRGKLQIFQKMDTEPQAGAGSPVLEYHAALVTGDLNRLEPLMDQFFQDANVVFEIKKDEMEWQVKSSATFGPSGLWTLEYKRELTTPLCIASARGHTACVSHLLARGADPDASPGGRGALHEACLGGHTACVQLLLRHRADPDLLSAEGLAPLHLCRTAASLGCAQALLEHGASVHGASGAGGDTPLHVAAQRGLDEHVRLYLSRGARVDARNGRGETALSAACGAARRPDEQARCLRLCTLLLRRGAAVDARDEDERSPLHKACGHARHDLARLLLRHGADAGALDYGGASPLARALQTAACAPQAAPQRTVQALLNHGSPTVWPDAFPKVLKTCAPAPAVIEVLFNSYPQLRVSESWKEVIPEEVFQMHQPFYKSFFALAHTPRCLRHLCRCAIRKLFGKKCFYLIPLLPLPKSLQNYLLLEPEGVLH